MQGGAKIDGNLSVSGTINNVDIAELWNKTAQPKTPRIHYLSIGSTAFSPLSDEPISLGVSNCGGAYVESSGWAGMSASISLPHGATITEFRFDFYDNSVSDMYAYLFAENLQSCGHVTMLVLQTKGQSDGYRSLSNTSYNYVVDNLSYSYQVNVYADSWDPIGELKFKGAVVTYTTTEAN